MAEVTFSPMGPVIQSFAIPSDVSTVQIKATGGSGGNQSPVSGNFAKGGLGASIEGQFNVTPGGTLSILVGEQGENGDPVFSGAAGGGGGGSFIWQGDVMNNDILLVAGGGAGAGGTTSGAATDGGIGGSGNPGGDGISGIPAGGTGGVTPTGGPAGTGPNPGGSGGASVTVDGGDSFPGTGGKAANTGGAGGLGFGGAGGGGAGGGGGGSFTGQSGGGGGGGGAGGGGGGNTGAFGSGSGGGGGSSLNNGTNQVNQGGVNDGDGSVVITYSSSPVSLTIECPADILVEADPTTCEAIVTFTPTITGGTPPYDYSCTPASGSSFNIGLHQVTCTVTDAASNTDSCSFNITVTPPPILIVKQPQDRTVTEGSSTTFSVVATGEDLTYQWQVSTDNGSTFVNLHDNNHYSGSQTNILKVINVPLAFNGNLYRAEVSDNCRTIAAAKTVSPLATVFSLPARLTVVPRPLKKNEETEIISITQTYDWVISTDTKRITVDIND